MPCEKCKNMAILSVRYYKHNIFCAWLALLVMVSGCVKKQPNAFLRGDDVSPVECSIPIMYIQMDSTDCENIHRSRNEHADAELLLIHNGDTLYDGSAQLKTRGNGSWSQCGNKKPYSIKFPKKQQLFHMDKSKSFVLLHNVLWQGGILQNSIAYELAKALGIPAPKDAVFLRVYVNGDYRGLYQMVNKVEVGTMGVNIYDLNKQNKHLNSKPLNEYPVFEHGRLYKPGHRKGVNLHDEDDEVTGGYLLDGTIFTTYYKDISGFISESGSLMRIREPKYATEREVNYIADYYNQMELAARAMNGINENTGKRYDEYLDVTSFVRYYLLQEVMQNGDAGVNSFHMYKDADEYDGKMYAGPAWDFDWLLQKHDCDLWACAKQVGDGTVIASGGLLHYLWQHADFRKHAKEDYASILYPAIQNFLTSGYVDSLQRVLYEEAIADSIRWGKPWYEPVEECFENSKVRLLQRSEFLYNIWSEDNPEWICVEIRGSVWPARDVYRYAKKEYGVCLPPHPPLKHSSSPTSTYYDAVSGDEIRPDTILFDNYVIYIHQCWPSWIEVKCKQIQEKLRKKI